jgi:hypothetical protein
VNPPQPEDERLRALLDDAVSNVEPRPALDRIQARTKVVPMNSRRRWVYAAAGAVAVAATVTAVALTLDDEPATTSGPAASESPTPTPAEEPSEEPSQTPTDEPSTAPQEQALAVYWVGDTPTGPRLFREFHRLPAGDDAIRAAVEEAVGGQPFDPDYYSPWAGLGVGAAGASYDGDVLTVDLDADPSVRERPGRLSREQAEMAVEQVLYTAQAALGEGNDVPVQLLVRGQRSDQVLGVPTAEPLAAGDPMDVQGTVWVTDPQDGDTVGSPFTVEGRGAFFEATVSWQLLSGDTVVDEGTAMAEECCTLSPYSFEVTAEPGNYVLRVYDADMSDGEGPGEAEDTKRITVR